MKILTASALAGTLLLGSCTSTGQVDMSKVVQIRERPVPRLALTAATA